MKKLLFILMCGITVSYVIDLGPTSSCTTTGEVGDMGGWNQLC